MAYVPVPKDLSKIKTKVAFNLTKRQLVCFGGGALIGVPLFFLLKGPVGTSTAAMCKMVVMLPFFLFAMYEKHGQPLEKILGNIIRVSVIRPKNARTVLITSMPYWNGRQISTRRCHTLFTAIKRWLHRLFGKNEEQTVQPVKTKKKLSRADKKQIEAAIARANRTDKKEKSAQDSIPMNGCGRTVSAVWQTATTQKPSNSRTSTTSSRRMRIKPRFSRAGCDFLNYFDSSIRFELSFLNLAASEETFARAISIPLQGDDFDSIRTEYTECFRTK